MDFGSICLVNQLYFNCYPFNTGGHYPKLPPYTNILSASNYFLNCFKPLIDLSHQLRAPCPRKNKSYYFIHAEYLRSWQEASVIVNTVFLCFGSEISEAISINKYEPDTNR